jgi:hypothetical protein
MLVTSQPLCRGLTSVEVPACHRTTDVGRYCDGPVVANFRHRNGLVTSSTRGSWLAEVLVHDNQDYDLFVVPLDAAYRLAWCRDRGSSPRDPALDPCHRTLGGHLNGVLSHHHRGGRTDVALHADG